MNKDIIYIDVEDDVTSIIQKVKNAKEKIVALVPPKNIGALQSAVNLRLLQKAGDDASKRIVLITNNTGLKALAAGVKIPVAKNLQSKPEIPGVETVAGSEEDDIINGEDLPVGELEKTAPIAASAVAAAEPKPIPLKKSNDDIELGSDDLPNLDAEVPLAAVAAGGLAKKAAKQPPKVPNFDRFRKWLFIGGGALVLLIAFFVLANIFWTGANVVITAKTSNQTVDLAVTLTNDGATNPDTDIVKLASKQLKKTASVDFTPTGKKNLGNKASGTMTLTRTSVSSTSMTIPAGTAFTSGSYTFFSNEAVTLSGTTVGPGGFVQDSEDVTVTAENPGPSYNLSARSYDPSVNGIDAEGEQMSGGTDRNVTVVASSDITSATEKLASQDATAAKAELTKQFSDEYIVIGESFDAQNGDAVSNPKEGEEATSAKLTRESTYTLLAVPKDQAKLVTLDYLNSRINTADQKVYDDGSKSATVSQFIKSPSGVTTAHIKTTGKIGPKIDETTLKTQLVGKKDAEIRQLIEAMNGVQSVDVSFSPFWKTTAPDADKIKISFVLQNSDGN